ncbi:MAG: hypothetical protein WD066_09115 [Planctomycetaceae bacterium]
MKQIALNAEIHFHEQELVSIFHETNVADKEEEFAELVFAAAFAIRSMSNLGSSPVTDSLGDCLALTARMLVDSPDELLIPKPKIISYPGHAGRKRFISCLRLSSSQLRLDYSAKGFSWLATGVGYYCPASVQCLFRYFARRRRDDATYSLALAKVSAGCAELQFAKQIQVTNHPQLVMMLVVTCMGDFIPDWLAE